MNGVLQVIDFDAEGMELDDHFIGVAGLIVAVIGLVVSFIALWLAVVGIREVREQVKLLIGVDRNLHWAKMIHTAVWRFVDPTPDTPAYEAMIDMQQFTMLERVLDEKKTLDSVQFQAYNEFLSHAVTLVERGIATWKPEMDETVIRKMAKDWQSEKNSELVKGMFGKKGQSIL